MKINKLRELYSKINIDSGMDQRIKERLLRESAYKETGVQKIRNRENKKRIYGYTGNRISMARILATVIISVCVFILAAFLLYGLRTVIIRFNDLWNKSISSEGMDNEAENKGDIISPEDEDSIVDVPAEDGEGTNEQPVNNGDETGNTGMEKIDGTDNINNQTGIGDGEEESDNTGSMEEGSGDTAESLPKGEPGNAGDTDKEMPEEIPGIDEGKNDNIAAPPSAGTGEGSTTGSFYFAFFDVDSNNGAIASIPYLVIRLKGKVNKINPADLTDVVLTRDGIPVNNNLRYTGTYKSFKWNYEDITDFYFAFEYDNVEPGKYGLTGTYKGEPFEVMEKIIEKPVSGEPADAGALRKVELWYRSDADYKVIEITELSFVFRGHQNAFYTSDLTELKCYRNGEEIPLEFIYDPFRYYESDGKGSANTMFNLIIKNPLTESGRYKVTGKYRGVHFETLEIVIP